MPDIYNVLIPVYKKDGTMKLGKRDVDAFSISFKKVGTANSMKEAKKKYSPKYKECRNPILQFADKEMEMLQLIREQDLGY